MRPDKPLYDAEGELIERVDVSPSVRLKLWMTRGFTAKDVSKMVRSIRRVHLRGDNYISGVKSGRNSVSIWLFRTSSGFSLKTIYVDKTKGS